MLNELQEQGLGQVLRRRLGILATGSPAPALAPELMPIISLESDRPEWGHLKGEKWAAAWAGPGATAAQVSKVRLMNDAASGTLITIRRICVFAAQYVQAVRQTNYPPGLISRPSQALDSRWEGTGAIQTVLRVTSGSEAATSPGAQPFWVFPPNLWTAFEGPVVLAPGSAIDIEGLAVNTALPLCSLLWTERAVIPGELLR